MCRNKASTYTDIFLSSTKKLRLCLSSQFYLSHRQAQKVFLSVRVRPGKKILRRRGEEKDSKTREGWNKAGEGGKGKGGKEEKEGCYACPGHFHHVPMAQEDGGARETTLLLSLFQRAAIDRPAADGRPVPDAPIVVEGAAAAAAAAGVEGGGGGGEDGGRGCAHAQSAPYKYKGLKPASLLVAIPRRENEEGCTEDDDDDAGGRRRRRRPARGRRRSWR